MASIEIFDADGNKVWDSMTAPAESPDDFLARNLGQPFNIKVVGRGLKWTGEITAEKVDNG